MPPAQPIKPAKPAKATGPANQGVWNLPFTIATVVQFFLAINMYLTSSTMALYGVSAFGLGLGPAGIVAGAFLAGGLISRFFAGRSLERYGLARMLALACAASAVFAALYFVVHQVVLFTIVRFLHGVAFGIGSTATATIVGMVTPRSRQGSAMGYYLLSQSVATAIGPFIGLLVITGNSYNGVFATCVLANIAGLALMPLIYKRIPGPAASTGELAGGNTARTSPAEENARFRPGNYLAAWVVPLACVSMVTLICFNGVVAFIGDFAGRQGLYAVAQYYFIIYTAVIIACRPFTGRLFDRVGHNVVIIPGCIALVAGFVVYALSTSPWMLVVSAVLLGYGMGTVPASMLSIVSLKSDPQKLGIANSTYFIFADLGSGLGMVIAGFLAGNVGYVATYLIFAVVMFADMGWYWLVHGRRAKE
jgi:MFS family permease